MVIEASRNSNDHWGSLSTMRRTFKAAGLDLTEIPTYILNGSDDLKKRVPADDSDSIPYDLGYEFRRSIGNSVAAYNSAGTRELASQVRELAKSEAKYEGLERKFEKMIRHSELRFLPQKSNLSVFAPTLVVKDSYYDDDENKAHELLDVVHTLAKKLGYKNIYIPNISLEFDKKNQSMTVTGGFPTTDFIDFGSKGINTRAWMRSTFGSSTKRPTEGKSLRKLFDFGRARAIHTDKEVIVIVEFPEEGEFEKLGIRMSHKEFERQLKEMQSTYTGLDGKPALMVQNRPSEKDSAPQMFDIVHHDIFPHYVLTGALDRGTPDHIVDEIYDRDWLFDKDSKSLILMPKPPDPTTDKHLNYSDHDMWRFIKFFTQRSSVNIIEFDPEIERHLELQRSSEAS